MDSTACSISRSSFPDVTMAVMLLMWFSQTDFVPFGRVSITLAHIAFNISFVAIIVRARLANMDPAMEDAASDLYASQVEDVQSK